MRKDRPKNKKGGRIDKEFFYYLRDINKHPHITVCLLKNSNGAVARGMAICSLSEQFDRKVGRKIAKSRAYSAMFDEKLPDAFCGVKRGRARYVLDLVDVPGGGWETYFDKKAHYMPHLTLFERRLLYGPEDFLIQEDGLTR